MFEDFSKRNQAVRVALELAEQHDWGDVSLADIAKQSGLDLAELRREFSCKTDLLRAFQAAVDAEVLAKTKPAEADDKVRDRLFDLLMTRFEVMGPYKQALRRIAGHMKQHPGDASLLVCSAMTAQYWMLSGAGAKLDGAPGAFRVAGLTALYGRVFKVWLEDESPSLDKTMATLDRGLGNGERALKTVDGVCNAMCEFVRGFKRPKESSQSTEPDPQPGPASA